MAPFLLRINSGANSLTSLKHPDVFAPNIAMDFFGADSPIPLAGFKQGKRIANC